MAVAATPALVEEPFPWTGHYMAAVAKVAYLMALQAIYDERKGKARMTGENNGTGDDAGERSDTDRTFAVMLGEVEDLYTRLTVRAGELTKEHNEVQAELERVEVVRAAMLGKAKPARKGGGARPGVANANDKSKAIAEWARERGDFTGKDAAEFLGIKTQGVGPVLAGMVRRGEATVREEDGSRIYTLA